MKKGFKDHFHFKTLAVAMTLACTIGVTSQAQANSTGLALVLDGSGSISPSEFSLQTGAYQNIFQNDFYSNYIAPTATTSNPVDELYVGVYQFGSSAREEVSYTLIDSDAAAFQFGQQFSTIGQMGGSTNTAQATTLAASGLISNGYDRKVIDVSTDGNPNTGGSPISAAQNAAASGVQVNALGVGNGINESFLDEYTKAGNGFYKLASDFSTFGSVLEQKLALEITGSEKTRVPEIDGKGAALAGSLLLAVLLIFRERRVSTRRETSCSHLQVA